MSLKHRVARLEKDAGSGLCGCPREQIVVVHPGEPDPPSPPRLPNGSCPTCGGRVREPPPRIIIRMPKPDGEAMKPLPAESADVPGTIHLGGVDEPQVGYSGCGENLQ